MTQTTLIEFPCHFPIKIIGANSPNFLEEIRKIAVNHFPAKQPDLTHKLSKDSNFLAITATVFAESKEMLDAFYQEVTKHPEVKMVL